MDHIAHYGVMGQKWGVRKDGKPQGFQYGKNGTASLGTGGLKGPSRAEAAQKTAEANRLAQQRRAEAQRRVAQEKASRKAANARRTTMSDSELRERVNRLEMEKRLDTLTKEQIEPGKTAVKEFLSSTGGKVATGVALAVVGATVTYAVNKAFPQEGKSSGEEAVRTFEQTFKKIALR